MSIPKKGQQKQDEVMKALLDALIQGFLGRFLRAEKFTGYRTQLCMFIYLAAWVLEKVAVLQGWGPEVVAMLQEIQDLMLPLAGLALASKVKRSGPQEVMHG